jgi:PAS domain S-box-containing protein
VTDIVEFDSYEKIIEAARSRDIAVFVVDQPPAHYFSTASASARSSPDGAPVRRKVPSRRAQGDVALLRLLEKGFGAITASEYREIDRRWLGKRSPARGGTVSPDHAGRGGDRLAVPARHDRRAPEDGPDAHNRASGADEMTQRGRGTEGERGPLPQLFEMESDAIFLIAEKDGQILEVNNAAAALYGFSQEELRNFRNTDLSAEPEKTTQATRTGVTTIPIRWHRKKDGTVFPVEIRATHFEWRGRRVHIAAIRDVTERQGAEEQLRFWAFTTR